MAKCQGQEIPMDEINLEIAGKATYRFSYRC